MKKIIVNVSAHSALVVLLAAALNCTCGGASLSISTTSGSAWKVSGGGAVNANPYILHNPGPFIIDTLSMTSTGTDPGTWVQGASQPPFDGFWVADFGFTLPANAMNISLTFTNFTCDDRATLTLNGTPFSSTATEAATPGQTYTGFMTFTDGGANQPWTFTGQDGYVAGTVTTGFNAGGFNLLEAVVNNTFQGLNGTIRGLSGGDLTYFGMHATLSYDVPEPSGLALLALGIGAGWTQAHRKRRFAHKGSMRSCGHSRICSEQQ
jgi:hypothetical protein